MGTSLPAMRTERYSHRSFVKICDFLSLKLKTNTTLKFKERILKATSENEKLQKYFQHVTRVKELTKKMFSHGTL